MLALVVLHLHMNNLSHKTRMTNINMMSTDQFDILVVGGGITGAGVALDAALRGYKVALVEKMDFASGTSSKSTKLVHGGIRYLPNFDFGLVREALIERGIMVHTAPYLVQPLPFVLPIYEGDRHPVGIPFTTPGGIGLGMMLATGLWMYDTMAGRYSISNHRRLSPKRVLEEAPALVSQRLKDGFVYYDAQTDDTRLTMAVLRTAAEHGAVIANYAEVIGLLTAGDNVQGAQVTDRMSGQAFPIRARFVVNATGVYGEQLITMTGKAPHVHVAPSKGVHLMLSREQLQMGDHAIVLPQTDDGRILFIVPWKTRAVFGTTDTGAGELDHPEASYDDVTYLLKHLNRYLTVRVTPDDIISVYAGYRPLIQPGTSKSSSKKLSRSHVVFESQPGLISVLGGKLTTYRRMAQDTVDLISRRDGKSLMHVTERHLLYGSEGWDTYRADLERQGKVAGLDADTIAHLGQSYGSASSDILEIIANETSQSQRLVDGLPYIWAEVKYAVQTEMAMKLDDILARRLRIILEDRQRGTAIAAAVARYMGAELNWSASEEQAQVAAYLAFAETYAADHVLQMPAAS
jgi:glycerol-3-phosphate dehydrogenase